MKAGTQFAAFVAAGMIAAVVNVAARLLLSRWMVYEAAVPLAYLCGMATAYALNRALVFARSGRGIGSEASRFALVNVLALAQVWLVSVGLARWLFPALGFAWHADTVAHVIGVASPIVTSYFAHKHFSFAPRRAP